MKIGDVISGAARSNPISVWPIVNPFRAGLIYDYLKTLGARKRFYQFTHRFVGNVICRHSAIFGNYADRIVLYHNKSDTQMLFWYGNGRRICGISLAELLRFRGRTEFLVMCLCIDRTLGLVQPHLDSESDPAVEFAIEPIGSEPGDIRSQLDDLLKESEKWQKGDDSDAR
jgi:hypothetical protein